MDIVDRMRLHAEDLHVLNPASETVKCLSLGADEIERQRRISDIYLAERNHARACHQKVVNILSAIHALLYPPRTTLPSGETFEFRSPFLHEQMQALSDRIRAIPDEIEKALSQRKIVFFKRRSDVAGMEGVMFGPALSIEQREALIQQFDAGKVETLLCPAGMVTGWRSSLWEDECAIEFVGEGWHENEKAQARGRVRPSFLRNYNGGAG